jgi:hypothetical protein
MSIDRDIEKMARHLIQKHGAKAQGVARSRIAELDREGDHGAAVVWREVLEAMKKLQLD